MIEIARSFTESDAPAKLVILDEPTSSLDSTAAAQLLAFLRKAVAEKLACILITHKLNEVLDHTRRIVVMKDATVVADVPRFGLSRDRLFELMGAVEGAFQRGDGEFPEASEEFELRDEAGAPRSR